MKEQMITNKGKITQLENLPPKSNPFHYDMERMGTQIGFNDEPGNYLLAMYTDRELGGREVILIDTLSGVQVKVKLPMLTWSQLSAKLELGFNYDKHVYMPYQKKVEEIGKCPNCGKADMGYIGLKRVRYFWHDAPAELHFGLCPECESIQFVDVKK